MVRVEKGSEHEGSGEIFRSRVLLRSEFSWLGISTQNLRSSSEAGVGSVLDL